MDNGAQEDLDQDGLGDVCDFDRDADGLPNEQDNCADYGNEEQADLDGDGVGDVCDLDIDGDGNANGVDNCVSVVNDQADLDGDSIGDACDADADGDLVIDEVDNCVGLANAQQTDSDSDGVGDACDGDADGDAVADAMDNCRGVPNAAQGDVDADGMGDDCDADADNDGMPNVEEVKRETDPLKRDSDGDGYEDRVEVLNGSDPKNTADVPPGVFSGGCSQVPVSSLAVLAGLLPALYRRRRWLLVGLLACVPSAHAAPLPTEIVPDTVKVRRLVPLLQADYREDGFYFGTSSYWQRDPLVWTSLNADTQVLVRNAYRTDALLGYSRAKWNANVRMSGVLSRDGALSDIAGVERVRLTAGRYFGGDKWSVVPSLGVALPLSSVGAPFDGSERSLTGDVAAQYATRRWLLQGCGVLRERV
jgi:hypothetical protein